MTHHHCQGCPGKGRKPNEEPCCRCDDPPPLRTTDDYPDRAEEWRIEGRMERLHGPNWDRHLSHDEEE